MNKAKYAEIEAERDYKQVSNTMHVNALGGLLYYEGLVDQKEDYWSCYCNSCCSSTYNLGGCVGH